MIEMQNVSVKYIKDFYAVLNYNTAINSNTLLLDENGKIVLRLLAKMDNYSGNIFYDNINLREIKNSNLPFAYLPESPVLFKHKSIFKNLIYPLKIRKIKDAKQTVENEIARHLLFLNDAEINTSDLNKLENQTSSTDFNKDDFNQITKSIDFIKKLKVYKLSKDEQQILCLLRAVIRQPKYLLIDNLFSTLTPKYHPLATSILSEFSGTIVAHENNQFDFYKNFKLIKTN